MKTLKVCNPFNAPVYHEETVTSTMDISRKFASEGAAHGSVIIADFQEAGRGRGLERVWEMERGNNLSFTILLRYPRIEDIPLALTLRTGLAVSLAIEEAVPSLKNKVKVKWPNDIIINDKKICGILCEADGGNVHIGIGINIMQKEFPPYIKHKATSIFLEVGQAGSKLYLLEKILSHLYNELENASGRDWKLNLEQRLYKKGERIQFKEGAADNSVKTIKGTLSGIGDNGELLIIPDGENKEMLCVTGELIFF
jgi:BirA family biotin operon repressor/biotin-[acetyl-CoA-carboxylase] ligase